MFWSSRCPEQQLNNSHRFKDVHLEGAVVSCHQHSSLWCRRVVV